MNGNIWYNGSGYPIQDNYEYHKQFHEKLSILAVGCIFCNPEINKARKLPAYQENYNQKGEKKPKHDSTWYGAFK